MQKAAKEFALQLPSDIDYRALLSMFETFNRNKEFEQFFDALPNLWELESSLEASVDPLKAFIKPNEKILSHALIGMMDRTLLSDLVPEEVKQRRIIICTKTVGATSLLGPWWTLHRVLCGNWLEFSRSVHFGLCVQDWKNISHPVLAFYAHCAVAVTLSRVQQRDDHWFQLASGQLKESKSLLQNYFAVGDTILLADTIFIIRRTIEIFSGSGDYYRTDIFEVSLKTLELICSFDIQSTLPELQHQFCDLWNELVGEAMNNPDHDFRSLCIMILKSIRRPYISLHENTTCAPAAFSMTTNDEDRVLADARSYPMCMIERHHPSTRIPELQLDEPPRDEPYVTASWMDTSPTSFQVAPPRLSTPPSRLIPLDQISPFTTDRNLPHSFIPSPVAPHSEDVPEGSGEVYSHQDADFQLIAESGYSSPSESLDIVIVPPLPPVSLLDISQAAYLPRGEDVPAIMGEVYSEQGAYFPAARSSSASTSSSESIEIVIEPPSPPESLSVISPMAIHAEDVPTTLGEVHLQQGAHVRFSPSESTSTSLSKLPVIDTVTRQCYHTHTSQASRHDPFHRCGPWSPQNTQDSDSAPVRSGDANDGRRHYANAAAYGLVRHRRADSKGGHTTR